MYCWIPRSLRIKSTCNCDKSMSVTFPVTSRFTVWSSSFVKNELVFKLKNFGSEKLFSLGTSLNGLPLEGQILFFIIVSTKEENKLKRWRHRRNRNPWPQHTRVCGRSLQLVDFTPTMYSKRHISIRNRCKQGHEARRCTESAAFQYNILGQGHERIHNAVNAHHKYTVLCGRYKANSRSVYKDWLTKSCKGLHNL